MTVLVKFQEKKFEGRSSCGRYDVVATVRYDDRCGNGYNTLSLSGEVYRGSGRSERNTECCGCVHEYIQDAIPEIAHMIKWHLVSSDGPMHYISNTTYHVEEENLDYARSTACWPEATDEELTSIHLPAMLAARLPELMEDFESDVVKMGFTY